MGRAAKNNTKRKSVKKSVAKSSTKAKSRNVKQKSNSAVLKQSTLNFITLKEEDSLGNDSELKQAQMSAKCVSATKMLISNHLVGAHVSAAGGAHNAVVNAAKIKARAFAFFLTSRGSWGCKEATEAEIGSFRSELKNARISIDQVVPHGIYLMNPGSPDEDTLKRSRDQLIKEVQKCEALGIRLYNFHPGSTVGKITVSESVKRCAESINAAHIATPKGQTILLVENMSRQGNTIGGYFEELRDILSLVSDRSRVGVCLDTCHTFAAGYDLRSETAYQKTMSEFDRIIGLENLRAIHLNDSKGALGDHKDRHENIGKGQLGVAAFRHIMNDERLKDIPMILETPDHEKYEDQIRLLYALNANCKS